MGSGHAIIAVIFIQLCKRDAFRVSAVPGFAYIANDWNETTFTIHRNDLQELFFLYGAPRLRYVQLQQNPTVRQLYIEHCSLTAVPRTIRNLPQLSRLIITRCQLRHLNLNDFVPIPALRALDLSGNKIVSIVELSTPDGTLTIQSLYLASNLLHQLDVSVFNGLIELQCLVLDQNRIENIQSRLTLPTLEEFSIQSNRLTALNVTGWCLPALKHMFCDHNQLTSAPAGWPAIWQIETLDLSYNRLRSFCMDDLYLTQLRTLNLAANELTNVTTVQTRLHIPLERFQAARNQLHALDISRWSMPNLWQFNVDHNRLTVLDDVFYRFPNVVGVELRYNPWSCEWLRRVHPGDLRRKSHGCLTTNHTCPKERLAVEDSIWICCW
uniref:Leucine rich immune protein (Coil-less) n=1 Tax=Anopheles dirus TaxID=7168 RepID=A0A182NHW5_9DIPT